MIQPRFVAWLKRAKSWRTSLVVEFKVVVVHESGHTAWPPNFHFADTEARRTKAIAIEAIKHVAKKDYPLSVGLLQLAGVSTTWILAKARERE
eukprot:1890527-Pleurochrysis_carterae.AAC.1